MTQKLFLPVKHLIACCVAAVGIWVLIALLLGYLRDNWASDRAGFAGDSDRQKAIAAGFDQHLVKPVDTGFLASLLG